MGVTVDVTFKSLNKYSEILCGDTVECLKTEDSDVIILADGSELPIKVLCGKPGYINFLDAFNGWQLVRELKEATGLPAATSFKHVSPAGAAVGLPLDETMRKIYWVDDMGDLSPLACAYARARGADRMSSFGDFISLSDVCDADTARIIKREVSDGVIAPGYTKEALEILESKKNGKYNVIEIDPDYVPAPVERKQVFGVTFEQGRNNLAINRELLENIVTENKELPDNAKIDMIVSLITLKYTQYNSVCYVKDGQAIGIGAGQQSRVHCTRLAGQKADNWYLRQSPQVLNLQFVDGIKRADRDNAIDVYIGEEYMDVLEEGAWQKIFKVKPPVFTREEKRAWLDGMKGVTIVFSNFEHCRSTVTGTDTSCMCFRIDDGDVHSRAKFRRSDRSGPANEAAFFFRFTCVFIDFRQEVTKGFLGAHAFNIYCFFFTHDFVLSFDLFLDFIISNQSSSEGTHSLGMQSDSDRDT